MKKALYACFFLCVFSTVLFAEEKGRRITIPFSVGSYYGSEGSAVLDSYRGIMKNTSLGLGLDASQKIGKLFLLSVENRFLFPVSVKQFVFNDGSLLQSVDVTKTLKDANIKSFSIGYSANILFGASFTPITNLNINVQAGIGGGGYVFLSAPILPGDSNSCLDFWSASVGVPLKVGLEYFFAEFVGLSVSIVDRLGVNFTGVLSSPGMTTAMIDEANKNSKPGFSNEFTFNIGPVFRW